MKKWWAVLLVIVIIIGGVWGWSAGVQIGRGYLVIGKGLRVQDKALLSQMVASGRETAGLYQPSTLAH